MYTLPELEKSRAKARSHPVAQVWACCCLSAPSSKSPSVPDLQFCAHSQCAVCLRAISSYYLQYNFVPPSTISSIVASLFPLQSHFSGSFKSSTDFKTKLHLTEIASTCTPALPTTKLPQTMTASPLSSPPSIHSQLIAVWHLPYHFCSNSFKGDQRVANCYRQIFF